MKRFLLAGAVLAALSGVAYAEEGVVKSSGLEVVVKGLGSDDRFQDKHVVCVPEKGHHGEGSNINPEISWSGAPEKTASYAIILVDTDVPTVFDAANKDGQIIPADLKRRDFYHWVEVDIPEKITSIAEGGAKNIKGMAGINDMAAFAASMKGVHGDTYDGPCPPWNDEILHHYHFKVFALDVASLGLNEGKFTAPEALKAMEGHILARGEAVATYTTNPKLLKK